MIAAAGASATSGRGREGMVTWLLAASVLVAMLPGVREAAEDVSRLKHLLVAAAVLALGRRRTAKPRRPVRRIVAAGAADRPRGEPAARFCFALVTVSAAAFIAVYALDRLVIRRSGSG